MPSLPIKGEKEVSSLKEARELVAERKRDGYKAFTESSFTGTGKRKKSKWTVLWY